MNKIEEARRITNIAISNKKNVLLIDPESELKAVQEEHAKSFLSCVQYAKAEKMIDTFLFAVHAQDHIERPWVIIVNGYRALVGFGRESETLVSIDKFRTPEFIRRGYEVHFLDLPQANLDGEIAESFRRNGFHV